MKYILTILIGLIFSNCFGQNVKTIYTSDSLDKRLIAYRDSLKRWKKEEGIRAEHIRILDAAENSYEYDYFAAKLGYTYDFASYEKVTADGKFACNTKINKNTYSLVTCFHSAGGDNSCKYRRIVPKPSVKVVYVPEKDDSKNVHIIYQTVYNDNITIDSAKTLIVNKDFSFFNGLNLVTFK
jgi:hypothetical protein